MKVAIIKYNAGNVYSVYYALKRLGVEAELTDDKAILSSADKVIFPGVGEAETTMQYLRNHQLDKLIQSLKQPVLGICLGMQIAVIEFARHVCGLEDANSGEFNEYSTNKVIDFMPGQNDEINKGGTLRLGAYPCKIRKGTVLQQWYGKDLISERHRHRYEFNNDYKELFEENGLVIGGTSPDGFIVETVELPKLKYYVGVQFHPEFKSRPNKPHPLFLGLIKNSFKGQ